MSDGLVKSPKVVIAGEALHRMVFRAKQPDEVVARAKPVPARRSTRVGKRKRVPPRGSLSSMFSFFDLFQMGSKGSGIKVSLSLRDFLRTPFSFHLSYI